ncbi:MAG TPA: hypothetical protein DCG75_15255 [Bacteroidales bacterium]|jgi:hypothetical protein|nr:hypothetical protein [Bacteroidales bacterium]
MKKVLLFGAITLLAAGFLTVSCEKDNPVSCTQKLLEVSSAQSAYIVDDSYENCIAYKNALEDYINCDGITDKAIYQGYLDNLTCTP